MDTFKERDLVLVKNPVLPEGERWLIITSVARNWITGEDSDGKSWTILKNTITSAQVLDPKWLLPEDARRIVSCGLSYEEAKETLRGL